MTRRWLLRWPYASLTANAALFVLVVTADFYGWIPGWATALGLVACAVWLFLNHALPRSWYAWLKPLARSQGWDGLLEAELILDAVSARTAGSWDQAAPVLEQAALVAARRGDGPKAMSCLTDAAMGYVLIDNFANARRCRAAAADLAGALADEAAQRNVRFVDGLIAWYSGDRDEAHRVFEDFAAHEAGADRVRAGVATLALAQMDSDEGNHMRGLDRLAALNVAELASPRMSLLGLLLMRTGQFKGARLALERGQSMRPLAHRTANAQAEDSLTFALLDLAEGNPEPAHLALLGTAERHSHDIRMLQGDLLTSLGGIEERKGSSKESAGELFNAALKAYEGIAPAKAASVRHHLDPASAELTSDPLALYYAWPPPAANEPAALLGSSAAGPVLNSRSRSRISPNVIASIGTAAVTLVFFLPLGWQTALGLLLLLAIHEFGHYFGARLVGVKARAPIFLGLIGAATIIDRKGDDPRRDAIITLAGPAAGLGVAVVCLLASLLAPSPWHTIFVALARGGFALNLLQLLPVLPLDGGHVASSLHRNWLIVGLLLQVGALALLFRSPSQSVTAIAFIAVTVGATVWMLTRQRPARPTSRGSASVATAYVAIAAIALGGLVAGFAVSFRAPTRFVGEGIIADGFTASVPFGWTAEAVSGNEVLLLVNHYSGGALTTIQVGDLKGTGIDLTNQFASSPAAVAHNLLAADLRRPGAVALTSIAPVEVPGLDGVEFTYTCNCQGGYQGEVWTSDVIVIGHRDRMLSVVLGSYTQEYPQDHASLVQLLSGWSWTD